MSKQKNRSSKRKTTLKYFGIIILSGMLGGIIGFGTAFARDGLMNLGAAISQALLLSSPWVFLFFCIAPLLLAFSFLQKGKLLARRLDSEDEASYEKTERLFSLSLGISSVATILIMTWYGLLVVARRSMDFAVGFLVLTAVMPISVILLSFLQRKCVEQEQVLNPEKRGDALELHFQKKWLESMDEQEKQAAYQAGFKAFRSVQPLALIMHVFMLLVALHTDMGFLPFLIIGLMWLVPNLIYLKECMKQNQVL